jgi:hypothetical protein
MAALLCKSITHSIAAILLLVCCLKIQPGDGARFWAVTGNRPYRESPGANNDMLSIYSLYPLNPEF